MLVFILSLLLQVESPITVLNRERVGLSIEINYRYFILKTVDRHVFGAEIDASEKQREEVDEFLKANSAISMAHYKQNLTNARGTNHRPSEGVRSRTIVYQSNFPSTPAKTHRSVAATAKIASSYQKRFICTCFGT